MRRASLLRVLCVAPMAAAVAASSIAAVRECPVEDLSGPLASGEYAYLQVGELEGACFLVLASVDPFFSSVGVSGQARPVQTHTVCFGDWPQVAIGVPRVPERSELHVLVLGSSPAGDLLCRSRFAVSILPHPGLSAVGDRVVVPVAGAVAGLHGSFFRTALQLRGYGTGTVYFRQRGSFFGDDRDPHLRYDLGAMGTAGIPGVIQIADVNAALGVSGVGQLDIVPDLLDQAGDPRGGWLAPVAEAFVYADSSHGRYGAAVPTLRPEELLKGGMYLQVPAGYPQGTRVNVGLRTFNLPATITPYVYVRPWDAAVRLEPLALPPHTYVQRPLPELLGDYAVVAGDLLHFDFEGGVVAAYASFTDNVSNDLRVVVDPDHWELVRVRDVVLPFPWWIPW